MRMGIDFDRTADDYAGHRAGFPRSLFDRLYEAGIVPRGAVVLDIGCGTGTLARGFVRRGHTVTGLDRSPEMLRKAGEIDHNEGVAVAYHLGLAENLPFAPGSFDVVSAGQCWHWFDRARAASEAYRVLRYPGRIVIAHFDWLPLPGTVVQRTEALILQHNPGWKGAGGDGTHPEWPADLSQAGFTGVETVSYAEPVMYTHEGWRGRVRANAGIGASLEPEEVERFNSHLRDLLIETGQPERMEIPHRVFVVWGTKEART